MIRPAKYRSIPLYPTNTPHKHNTLLPQVPLPDVRLLPARVQHRHIRANIAHVGSERPEPAVAFDVALRIEVGDRLVIERLGSFPAPRVLAHYPSA